MKLLNGDDLDSLGQYKECFNNIADSIENICSKFINNEENILYLGFELGQMHTYLKQNALDMQELLCDINSRKSVSKIK